MISHDLSVALTGKKPTKHAKLKTIIFTPFSRNVCLLKHEIHFYLSICPYG